MESRYVWLRVARSDTWPKWRYSQCQHIDQQPDHTIYRSIWDFRLASGQPCPYPFTRRRSSSAGAVAGCADFVGLSRKVKTPYPALKRLALPHSPLLSWAGILSFPSRGRAPLVGRPNRPASGARTFKWSRAVAQALFIEEVCHATG